MPEPIISVSGLRGIVGESLTPEVALRFACAFAAEIPAGPIVITRDGRATGRMLADAIRSGLQATGRDVIDADVAATPTTGVLVRHVQAAGGIQISASHNPSEYNGLKLFSSAGQVISAAEGQKVIARYRSGEPNWVLHSEVGSATTCLDPDSPHKVLVEKTVNLARLQGAHFNVLLDSNHGAGSDLGSMLLESLGCRVTVLGGEPDGKFEHLPEPTAANLVNVLNRVPQTQAHIGFCQDPDADRLAIIDEKGRYIGEEYTLALVVDHLLRQRKGPVVTNCSTSQMSEELAKKYRVPFYRSAVGEANVVAVALARFLLPVVRRAIPELVDYSLPSEGGPGGAAVLAIRKSYPMQAHKAAAAFWGLELTMCRKLVIVVDEHVDVHDAAAVLRAVAANVHPGRDAAFHPGPAHPLDHAAPTPLVGQHLCLDATAKLPGEHPGPWPARLARS